MRVMFRLVWDSINQLEETSQWIRPILQSEC
jgi:hypothetical protein